MLAELVDLVPGLQTFNEVEAAIVTELAPAESALEHFFAPGLYARQLTLQPGTLATGRVHKTCHLTTLSEGEVTVWGDDLSPVRIKAPHTFLSPAGTRRMVFCHERTVWTTYHPTELTDLGALEAALTEAPANPLLPPAYLAAIQEAPR